MALYQINSAIPGCYSVPIAGQISNPRGQAVNVNHRGLIFLYTISFSFDRGKYTLVKKILNDKVAQHWDSGSIRLGLPFRHCIWHESGVFGSRSSNNKVRWKSHIDRKNTYLKSRKCITSHDSRFAGCVGPMWVWQVRLLPVGRTL